MEDAWDLLDHKWMGDDRLEEYYRRYFGILVIARDRLSEEPLRVILVCGPR